MSPTIRLLHQLVHLEAGSSVCDVACGAGHLALSFATRAGRLAGVDPAPGMLDAFRRLAAERGREVETVEAFAESIPLRGRQFDLVVSRLAPHHFNDVDRAVAEMVRLTKSGGRVAIIDLEGHEDADIDEFNHKLEFLHDPTHVRSYTAARWRSMFESSGLKVEVLKDGLSERPQGTTVRRWCEIGSSGTEAEAEIRASLRRAPNSFLEALNIRRMGGEFLLPIRTLLVVGTRNAPQQSVVKVPRAPRPFLRPPDKARFGAHTGSMCAHSNAVRACAGTVECRDDFCHGLPGVRGLGEKGTVTFPHRRGYKTAASDGPDP